MTVAEVRYRSLEDLLAREPICEEDPATGLIMKKLDHVKFDARLSRREFLDICTWKSPRAIHLCERNSARSIVETCRNVFGTRDERKRLELLTRLKGVSIPTASAILTLTDPGNYGVIDIRVWQLLYQLHSVRNNPGGQAFTFGHWDQFLHILRHHAKRLRVPVRLVELTLFKFHSDHQTGTLYRVR